MNTIAQTETSIASGYTASSNITQNTKTEKENQASGTSAAKKTSKVTNGRTIGEPELSDKAKKYYDQLRKKYSNMDFILVSRDMKEQAQANAGKFANPSRMVVLIDEEKIERMAEDENFRKQYEGIISSAAAQMPQLSAALGSNQSVKGFGMEVKNGTASFFAVIDKSLAAQKERISKKAEQKAEEKKKDKKAAEKKRTEDAKAQKAEDEKKAAEKEDENLVTVTASSMEELLKKIDEMMFSYRSDSILSDQERKVGQLFDAAW